VKRAAEKARKAAKLYLAGDVDTVRLAAERFGVSASSVVVAIRKLRDERRAGEVAT
jgi:hypothetical protein